MPELIVRKTVTIDAPPAIVWDVLTKPEFIQKWDEVPEGFQAERLSLGSEFIWEHGNPNKDITKLTVTEFEPHKRLIERWYSSPVALADGQEINYSFSLSEDGGKTTLVVSIGDWGLLETGQDYYDASVEFADTAVTIIAELAEGLA